MIRIQQQTLADRSANVITSPLLVKTTEQITARVMNEAGLKGDAIEADQNRPNIKNTAEGIHVQSKREYVDKTLERLQIPHTTSDELELKGYQQATAELNERIKNDTQGTAIPARVIRDNSTKASSQFYLLRNRKL